jgi:transposase
MEILVERACGLDVHQATVVACVLTGEPGSRPKKEIRTFGTCLRDLEELRDWLTDQAVTHVAMESTGVYWKPVYTVLEGSFELVVGNAFHIKNVPGRKTDAKDSEWIADLLRHGLIAKSFVPPKPIRELRELMRYRRKVLNARSGERNRLLRLLETANIKVSSVASNVFGKSGMAMLEAIARGECSGEVLAELAQGLLKKKREQLAMALEGHVEEHHRFLLRVQLDRMRGLDASLRTLDEYIDAKMAPYQRYQQALEEIPGVGSTTARALIAEIGVDMSVFGSDHRLAAWAGMCPGNNESGGKRLGGSARKGNLHVRYALVEASRGAIRKKDSYFRDKYYRLKARRGGKRAALAIAHKMLVVAYHVINDGYPYRELGGGYLDSIHKARTSRHLVRRLEGLGFHVQVEPA